MLASQGSPTHPLTEHDVQQLLAQASTHLSFRDKRVLVIIPDRTRTAPIPMLFKLLYEQFGHNVAQLDYLIALGTHPPLADDAIDIYIGSCEEAFSAAADLSAQLNIIYVDHPYKCVLSQPATHYDDLWTAAKAMYKTEPAIADGGEVILYAPHIKEISFTHGKLIDEVGYHVRDYFLKQPDRFADIPGTILAHSTHVKGMGSYDATAHRETSRIQVTLATGIPEERCRLVNLGYLDYHTIHPQEWQGREQEGILYVPHAGEMLYRAKDLVSM